MTTRTFVALMGVMIALSVEMLFVYAARSAAPTVIHSVALPCEGTLNYLDTDGDPTNGAERLTVTVPGEPTPRAVVTFGDGAEGQFKSAHVTLPGKVAETYTDHDRFAEVYPHPCVIVEATRDEARPRK